MIVELSVEMFGMKDFKDTPVLPQHIEMWPENRKWEVLTSLIKPVADKLFLIILNQLTVNYSYDKWSTLPVNIPLEYQGTKVTLSFPTAILKSYLTALSLMISDTLILLDFRRQYHACIKLY